MTRLRRVGVALAFLCALASPAASQPPLELTDTVNDFARIVDSQSRRAIDEVVRELHAASGDAIVVATVPTVAPYSDVREYAAKLFENQGRGIGDKGKDNGLLVLVAVDERRVWIEVGYGLEQWITDGFAGETARDAITPEFRAGRYGAGLLAGVTRLATRIAEGRQVRLRGAGPLQAARRPRPVQLPLSTIIIVFVLIVILSRLSGGPGRPVSRWGRHGWSGWSGGIGPFGGGGGGGFGGGFGGFGGGRSGGGGGGGGW